MTSILGFPVTNKEQESGNVTKEREGLAWPIDEIAPTGEVAELIAYHSAFIQLSTTVFGPEPLPLKSQWLIKYKHP